MNISLQNILRIPLYYDSPSTFSLKLKKKFQNEIKEFDPIFSSNKALELIKENFSSRYPNLHKYNNILGYAELEVDGSDILIYYYLNGDNRKIYNKNNYLRKSKSGIYFPLNHYYGGKIREFTNIDIRMALNSSFVELQKQCKEWKVYVDLQPILEIIDFFDFSTYLKKNNEL